MIISCPNCETKYKVKDEALPEEGREVRCTNCAHEWWFTPSDAVINQSAETVLPDDSADIAFDDVVEEVEAEVIHDAADESAGAEDAISSKKKILVLLGKTRNITLRPLRGLGAHMSWDKSSSMAFTALCAVTLIVMLVFKNSIVQAMPHTALFYNTLGIHVPVVGEGLKISNMVAERQKHGNGKTILSIEAMLANISEEPLTYPPLDLFLQNGDEVLKDWHLKTNSEVMEPGQAVPVKIHLKDIPEDAKTVVLKVSQKASEDEDKDGESDQEEEADSDDAGHH